MCVVDASALVDLLHGENRSASVARRVHMRLADALYVELAARLAVPLITTDRRLARATPVAEGVGF